MRKQHLRQNPYKVKEKPDKSDFYGRGETILTIKDKLLEFISIRTGEILRNA